MNKQTWDFVRKSLAATLLLLGLYACSDAWDSHYATDSGIRSDNTLWGNLEAQANLSDFREILDSVHVSSYNNSSMVSYAELLNAEQTFTTWAPVNGTFNKDSLLALCQTEAGQLSVEKSFVRNHIARYLFSVTDNTNVDVLLLNGKEKNLKGFTFSNVDITTPNILATNGVLHILSGKVPYLPNIFESFSTNPEFSKLSAFFKTFQKDSLDEFASVSSGIVDGSTVYVDSVLIQKNSLMDELGHLNEEDSSYLLVAPSDIAWNDAYSKIAPYFNFAFIANADSMKNYWTKHTLVNDLVFNTRLQTSPNDSLVSTKFNSKLPLEHVFRKPYDTGGILSQVTGSTNCSNGTINKVDKWPFSIQQAFFKPIKMEGEQESNILEYLTSTLNFRTAVGKGLSNNEYLDLLPTGSYPSITFQVKNTLAGKYDVCIVLAPQTVYKTPVTHADSLDVFRPVRFRATLYYADATGAKKTYNCANGGLFSNNAYKLDTVCVAPAFKFPTCNLNQNETTVSLKILSFVTSGQLTTYSRELLIDCIYLKPRED
jgi:hypothetical protein